MVMWLDKLASQANAPVPGSPQSRPYSPSPRKAPVGSLGPYTTSQRPGIGPRIPSSISIVSNDSAGSFLGSSRRTNGSTLRQSTTMPAPNYADEPRDLLYGIFGMDPGTENLLSESISSDDLALEFDFGDLPLHDLARDVQWRTTWKQDNDTEKSGFEALHNSIQACDGVLSSVEANLASFHNDLAVVSADIESLQARSANLNVRLDNRAAVEKALGPIVEDLSVSPALVTKIIEGPIDDAWIKALGEVDRRMASYRNSSSSPQQNKSWTDLGPLLEKLVAKASERIRDFFVVQIKSLRSPHINAQIIQQQSFTKFSGLFAFLYRYHAALADDICQAYMNTMRWYYVNQFSRYERALATIKLHGLDRNDVIGHGDSSRKSGVLSSSRPTGPSHEAFNLGRRGDVLKAAARAALPSYLAEEEQGTHHVEMPFRNFNLALIDNAAAEYTFLIGFFSPPYPFAVVSRHFNYIFEPTFNLGHGLTKTLISESFDGLGLLICVRLTQQLAFELQRRKVPAMDSHINATNMLLWPRLQVIMDRHCESIRQLTGSLPTTAGSKAEQAKQTTAPHVLTQRFGQFLHGVLTLSVESGDDEPIVTSLHRLRSDVEQFLVRNGMAFGNDSRKSGRFLYNNYSLILTIISDVDGKLAREEREHFEQLRLPFRDES